MKLIDRLYPNPVLSADTDDYNNSSFTFTVDPVQNVNQIELGIKFELENKELEKLIQEGKAEYVVHIENSETCFRQAYAGMDSEMFEAIPVNRLNGKVSICAFILAKEVLPHYTNADLNEDYEGLSFWIDRGGILAVGGSYDMDVDNDMGDLKRLPSIFSICKYAEDTGTALQINLENDKIIVSLSNDDFATYNSLSTSVGHNPIFHSMIIFPTLIYVFESLQRDGIESYEEFRWFRAIKKTLYEKYDITLDQETVNEISSYDLAQRILDMPIHKAFDSMVNETDEEDSGKP